MWYGGPSRGDGMSDAVHGSGGAGSGAVGSNVVVAGIGGV
jgi:hypothetical protein